jgi:hypothetical protein
VELGAKVDAVRIMGLECNARVPAVVQSAEQPDGSSQEGGDAVQGPDVPTQRAMGGRVSRTEGTEEQIPPRRSYLDTCQASVTWPTELSPPLPPPLLPAPCRVSRLWFIAASGLMVVASSRDAIPGRSLPPW